MHKLTGFKIADLRQHHGQQRIGGNIERHAQKHVAAALIQHAGKFAVRHIKLKHHMTRRQAHFGNFAHIPGRNNHSAVVGIVLKLVNHLCQLINSLAVPVSPLRTVNRSQITVFICPFVPDSHAVILQILNVCISLDKPQKLMNNAFKVHFLGRHQRKTLAQIKTHLLAENRTRSDPGTVHLVHAVLQNIAEHVQILFHCSSSFSMASIIRFSTLCSTNSPLRTQTVVRILSNS